MNAPFGPEERKHKVRACVGNGLRPDIYAAFQKRFGIRSVLEFYGSTEGNAVMVNFDFKPGAVGRIPAWAAARFPMALVAFDVDADSHPRDAAGLCRPSAARRGWRTARRNPRRPPLSRRALRRLRRSRRDHAPR